MLIQRLKTIFLVTFFLLITTPVVLGAEITVSPTSDANAQDAIIYFYEHFWPLLKKKIPGVKFYVVGRFPTERILEIGKKEKDIIVTGAVDDVRPYFRKTRVFICPVRMGTGFRGKVLEAMSMGVPIVSTELGANGVPIKDMENVVIAEEPRKFTNRIVELFEDDTLRKKIAQNARKLVEERFAWEKGVEVLEKVLQNVVS